MTYANNRRDQYREEVLAANNRYNVTTDLAEFQAANTKARETWHADIRAHYTDTDMEAGLMAAISEGGRVYAELNTGEIVRLHRVAGLYEVTDTTGAPAEPLVARIVGNFRVSHATTANLINHA